MKIKRKRLSSLAPNKKKVEDEEPGFEKRRKGSYKNERLVLDRSDNNEYGLHYRMLKLYIEKGLTISKIN